MFQYKVLYSYDIFQVFFPKAVVTTEIILHLRADGSTDMDKNPQTIRVELITAKNNTVPLSPETTVVSCRQNPIHIHVTKDLSQPFFLTKGLRVRFSAFNTSIAGIRMRSSKFLNPVNIAECTDKEVFNPRSGRCVQKACTLPICDKLYIKNGKSVCSGYREGDVCNLTCSKG